MIVCYLYKFFVVHGDWSPWSAWSTCPQICGKTFQSRTRTCTNPEPKNNGRICIGSEREEELCPEIICKNGKILSFFFLINICLKYRMECLFKIMWWRNTKTKTIMFK